MHAPATQPVIDLAAAGRQRAAADRHWLERLESQAGFAEALGEFHPAEAAAWQALAAQARQRMAAAAAAGGDLAAACAAGEAILAPVAATAKSHVLHCVGHAHIDMNWMWGWPETVAVTVDTVRTMLTLLDEFPAFTFAQSQASVYAIIRDHAPDLLPRIAARVREGRWEVVAAHWVEGDRNLAGGEALCRHLLHTRALMRELFGLEPEDVPVDWSPDTFGHAATIPTIDTAGAAKYLYCCRTGATTDPAVFWWRAPDGSRLLVNRETNWYNSEAAPAQATNLLRFRRATGLREWLMVYGVGDHGGGPTRRDLRRILDMDAWPVFPRFRCGRVADWFKRLEADGERWPIIDRELNCEFTGCYTSQASIKRGNRISETVCAAADGAAALAQRLVGRTVPRAVLRDAWTETLFSHFHDILPGSGVAATRHYHQGQVQSIQAAAGQVRSQSLRAIAERIDTRFAGAVPAPTPFAGDEARGLGAGAGRMVGELSLAAWVGDGPRPLVVFNPSAWTRQAVVRLTVWDGDGGDVRHPVDRAYTAVLPDGSVVAPQRLGTGGAWGHASGDYWGHRYADLAVPVNVPAGGWTTVVLREQAPPSAQPVAVLDLDQDGGHGQRSNNPAGRLALRNEHLRLRIDRRSGAIASLVDLATGVELAAPGCGFAALELQQEQPVRMSAWILGDPAGPPRELTVESIEPQERGPWRVSVAVRLRCGDSRFTVVYGLDAGARRLDIAIDGRWLERGDSTSGIPRLQMRFPSALTACTARYEVPFGAVTRPAGDGREVPALRWAAIDGLAADGQRAGFAVLNDGKHGHSLHGSVLRLNLIRSSYDPDPLPELGDHAIRLAVVPWSGQATTGDLVRWAEAHDAPLVCQSTTVHDGTLPPTLELLRSEHPDVLITQLKSAERSDELVLRVHNTAAEAIETAIVLAPALMVAQHVRTCDVLERSITGVSARLDGSLIRLRLPAFALATLAVG